ncbi:(4Fe-4S)-binding protein [Streptomyces sp. NPDC051219]|uniref:ferredoxin n=1 Tax=Streptomyces sp. NPDC051219 TaxID=3155283 RepID=UPI003433B671
MKITVDYDLCEGRGVCVQVTPAVFDLDENELTACGFPDPTSRPPVEQAVRSCPDRAFSLDSTCVSACRVEVVEVWTEVAAHAKRCSRYRAGVDRLRPEARHRRYSGRRRAGLRDR